MKIHKLDLIKLKSFCKMKGAISKMKRKPSDWEKIIANKTTGKELIFKIYKQLCSSIPEKELIQSKMGQRTKQTFL